MKCSHLHNVVQLSLVELCKLKKDESCTDCDTNGPNLWICLQKNCLHIGCSEQYKDHSTIHFQSNRTHSIHMNLSSQRVWCYLCESELFLTKQMHHQQQQPHHHHYHHHRRTSVVSNDSSDTSRYSSANNDKLVVHADKLMSGAAAAAVASAPGYAAAAGDSCDSSGEEDDFERQGKWNGLVGLQNLANTCYMNAAIQALSNSPPLTGFFLDCGSILETDLLGGTNPAVTKPGLAKHYHKLIREMWCKNRRYVVPSGILCGIRIVHPMFRGYQQHDTQEFLRCFMDQLHEELKEVTAPPPPDVLTAVREADNELEPRLLDRPSPCSSPSPSQSEGEYETCDSGVSEQSSLSDDPLSPAALSASKRFRKLAFRSPSPPEGDSLTNQRIAMASRTRSSPGNRQQSPVSTRSTASSASSTMDSGMNVPSPGTPGGIGGGVGGGTGGAIGVGGGDASDTKEKLPQRSIISDIFDGKLLSSVQCLTCDRVSTREETFQDLSLPIPGKDHLAVLHQTHTGMGIASSAGSGITSAGNSSSSGGSNIGGGPNNANNAGSGSTSNGSITCSDAVYPMVNGDSWLWWFWNSPFWSWVRSWFWGPAVTLHDCMAAFFSADELKGDNMYSCERCNKLRNGVKYSRVLALPEMLCVHLKRFRHDLSYSSKISSPVHFPLYGLDMRPYLHKDCKSEVTSYDLCAVICHHGTVGGGHYTSFAKHDPTGKWFEFDDQLVTQVTPDYVQSCEAYVLFYRKNNARIATVRAQASNLLTMQEQASDIRFYVSRNWLHRFNTFAEPGPIDNWTLLCPHGAFPPNKASHFSKLVVPFPQALWDFLYKKFGGGPVCNHIFPCHICKKAAETLSRRQRYELEAFTAFNDEFQFNDTPTTIYAISMAWFRQWQLFARGLTTDDPGPINNKTIVMQGDTSVPLRSVRPFSDYAQINANLWHFFHGIYGGGPEIVLQGNPVPPQVSAPVPVHSEEYVKWPQQPRQQKKDHSSESMDAAEDDHSTSGARSATPVKQANRDSVKEVTITEPPLVTPQQLDASITTVSASAVSTAAAPSTRSHKSVSFEDTYAFRDNDSDDDVSGEHGVADDGGQVSSSQPTTAGGGSSASKRQSTHSRAASGGSSRRIETSGSKPVGTDATTSALKRKQEHHSHQAMFSISGNNIKHSVESVGSSPMTNGDTRTNMRPSGHGVDHLEIGTKKDRRHKASLMKSNGFFGAEGKYQSASIDYSNEANAADNGLPRTESFTHYQSSVVLSATNGVRPSASSLITSSSVPSFGTAGQTAGNASKTTVASEKSSLLTQSSMNAASGDVGQMDSTYDTTGAETDVDEDVHDSKSTGCATSGSSVGPSSSAKAYQQHSGRKGGHHHHHSHHNRPTSGAGGAYDAAAGLTDKIGGRDGGSGGVSFGRRKLKMKYMKKLAGRSGSGTRSSRNSVDSDGVSNDGGTILPLAINGGGEVYNEGVK